MKNELEYSRMLENTGLSREHAEVHLRVIENAMKDNFATKFDLYEVRNELKERIDVVEARLEGVENRLGNVEVHLGQLEGRMGQLESRMGQLESKFDGLESKFNTLEYKIVNKIGLMIVGATTVLGALATLLKFAF